jgi:hypothetical protein
MGNSSPSPTSRTTTATVTTTIKTTFSRDEDDQILAAALSAILGKEILPESSIDQSLNPQNVDKVSLFDQYLASFEYGKVGSDDEVIDETFINLNITILASETSFSCSLKRDATVDQLKQIIYERQGLLCNTQNLIYCGREIDDGHLLSEYGIQDASLIFVFPLRTPNTNNLLILDSDSRDLRYDYDFTNVQDKGRHFYRGGIEYYRPCGWRRYAIKVKGKYESNAWLGPRNNPNEWPVSYHGTGCDGTQSIAQAGHDLTKGKRFKFGYGIYSTPDINIAKRYAKSFTVNNNRYYVVCQNRVNPKTLTKISAKQAGGQVEYWISPSTTDMRPYGYCIFKE